ncbi:hypothetical protein B0H16DRAFT_1744922 [Mycena metata]|uniref:Uncharacterized protein n=1 Tax=Mycena metata TaxID=1033252 RepID=A0AAD7H4K3_9AGAR|nr:hypothetical protein B0H16DRAFT_1744922 [Mycena metata]
MSAENGSDGGTDAEDEEAEVARAIQNGTRSISDIDRDYEKYECDGYNTEMSDTMDGLDADANASASDIYAMDECTDSTDTTDDTLPDSDCGEADDIFDAMNESADGTDNGDDSEIDDAPGVMHGPPALADVDPDFEEHDETARAFRCWTCDLSIQFEACCAQMHVAGGEHVEWMSPTRSWGRADKLGDSMLLLTMPKICGICAVHIAARKQNLPAGTFACRACGPTLLCDSCCTAQHLKHPLHVVQIYKPGCGWETTTLGYEGFVYQLGHRGAACRSPQGPAE